MFQGNSYVSCFCQIAGIFLEVSLLWICGHLKRVYSIHSCKRLPAFIQREGMGYTNSIVVAKRCFKWPSFCVCVYVDNVEPHIKAVMLLKYYIVSWSKKRFGHSSIYYRFFFPR